MPLAKATDDGNALVPFVLSLVAAAASVTFAALLFLKL
jgi:hypothetical protein